MEPKPQHLGVEYAAQFSDPAVVTVYHQRPPYPPAIFPILADLIAAPVRTVLDVGCGTGDIARGLVPFVDRVDALDISAPMIEAGRRLPGGDHTGLHWQLGSAEDAPLDAPYGLITAGESLHWMAWDIVLPRFRRLLLPGGVLAIIGRRYLPRPWDADEHALMRYSTNRHFQPYDLIEELQQRGLFTPLGRVQTAPLLLHQSVEAYIDALHSRNGFSRDRMQPAQAAEFDRELGAVLAPYAVDGMVATETVGSVVWGTPEAPRADA
ncbi:MAG: class I SAM-dependent methyltransferase [Dehalococcoidia bacterium]